MYNALVFHLSMLMCWITAEGLLLSVHVRQYTNSTTAHVNGTDVTATASPAATQTTGGNGTPSAAQGTAGTTETAAVRFASLIVTTQYTIQEIQNGMNASTANSSNSVYQPHILSCF